jgi:hypothetical protein
MRNFGTALIASALTAQSALAITSPIVMDPKTRMMRDADGAAVIFHGVNVVYKVDPYIPSDGDFDPQDSLNDKDIADL